jgi:hypothetical protein
VYKTDDWKFWFVKNSVDISGIRIHIRPWHFQIRWNRMCRCSSDATTNNNTQARILYCRIFHEFRLLQEIIIRNTQSEVREIRWTFQMFLKSWESESIGP